MGRIDLYHDFTLPNGLKCIHKRETGNVTYCGIAINAGSSNDFTGCDGLAHFVEHTIFKGTARRSSWHINNRMESVGGELNAYTTKEDTLIYTSAPKGNTQRSLELISDLVSNATFPTKEINREKEVVIEEINSYLDSPADSVFDEFEERLYAGSGLSHNILGAEREIRKLSTQECLAFIDFFYTPANMVLYCADNLSHARFESYALKFFGDLRCSSPIMESAVNPPINPAFNEKTDNNGHQAHTIYGTRTFSRYDNRRFALFLLNNYLGGPCMNSRLNILLREKTGYVYTVDSSVALYSKAGHIQIYFGADKDNVNKCLRIISNELRSLAESPMNPRLFEKIKRQYIGQLLVSSDHREASAMALGKSLLHYGEIHDTAWTADRISEVSPEEMRTVAEILVSGQCSSLTIM